MNRINERLLLFQDLISCVCNLYIWKYDTKMNLLISNCPNQEILSIIFSLENFSDYIMEYASKQQLPLVFSNSIDMTWITLFEMEKEELSYIYLLGPVFTNSSPFEAKKNAIDKLSLSAKVKHNFMSLIETLPVIGIVQYLQYATMMHYCITKQKINISDFHYYESSFKSSKNSKLQKIDADKMSDKRTSYLYEQKFLKMIEEGNISYLSEHKKSPYTGTIGKLSVGDSLRQTKNMIISSIVLCTRAAIKGGLAPEVAYVISDNYIQNVESCKTTTEVAQVNYAMQTDFITRVHKCRTKKSISSFAKMCCDYIDLHIRNDFSLEDLSEYTGYTKHYLGKKFKKEMNISINQYINNRRIEFSKLLLETTTLSIADISDNLHFCSPSYFTKLFHQITSNTPIEYRESKL